MFCETFNMRLTMVCFHWIWSKI